MEKSREEQWKEIARGLLDIKHMPYGSPDINDPDEMHNLWFDENYKEVRHELVDKLLHEVMNAQSLYPKQQGMA